ncbi:MAG: hypothetical protein ACI94Y_003473 [Maribacter sp.]|jgi:hypothetical protein
MFFILLIIIGMNEASLIKFGTYRYLLITLYIILVIMMVGGVLIQW